MTDELKNQGVERTAAEIGEILCRVDSLPVLNSSSEDEILGYDESGVPANVKTS